MQNLTDAGLAKGPASVYNCSGKQKRRLLTLRLTLLWFL